MQIKVTVHFDNRTADEWEMTVDAGLTDDQIAELVSDAVQHEGVYEDIDSEVTDFDWERVG